MAIHLSHLKHFAESSNVRLFYLVSLHNVFICVRFAGTCERMVFLDFVRQWSCKQWIKNYEAHEATHVRRSKQHIRLKVIQVVHHSYSIHTNTETFWKEPFISNIIYIKSHRYYMNFFDSISKFSLIIFVALPETS